MPLVKGKPGSSNTTTRHPLSFNQAEVLLESWWLLPATLCNISSQGRRKDSSGTLQSHGFWATSAAPIIYVLPSHPSLGETYLKCSQLTEKNGSIQVWLKPVFAVLIAQGKPPRWICPSPDASSLRNFLWYPNEETEVQWVQDKAAVKGAMPVYALCEWPLPFRKENLTLPTSCLWHEVR